MPRKLFDIEISEITLCKSPANRKKFFIRKSKETVMTLIEKLKKFLAESDEDIEKVLTSEQVERIEKLDSKVQKEMEENLDVVLLYEDVPDDLESVHKYAFKQIIDQLETQEVDKAGAKLSKTTQALIKEALGLIKDGPKAVAILETLLGIEPKKTKKGGDGDENLSEETQAKLTELAELKKEKAEADQKQKEKDDEEKLEKLIEKKLEEQGLKKKGTKKSIDGQEGDKKNKGADDEEEDDYPSIPLLVKN